MEAVDFVVTATPIGDVCIQATAIGVRGIWFIRDDRALPKDFASSAQGVAVAAKQHCLKAKDELDAYFSGQRTTFTFPLALHGTEFQLRVWEALLAVPYGSITDYSTIAAAAGRPKAIRAAASAVGANPVGVVVPCHRVLRKSGALGGYRGGLDRKVWLLEHEQK